MKGEGYDDTTVLFQKCRKLDVERCMTSIPVVTRGREFIDWWWLPHHQISLVSILQAMLLWDDDIHVRCTSRASLIPIIDLDWFPYWPLEALGYHDHLASVVVISGPWAIQHRWDADVAFALAIVGRFRHSLWSVHSKKSSHSIDYQWRASFS